MEPDPNPAAAAPATDEHGQLRRLEAQLAAEVSERQRLRRELDVRNCALDAAATHFIIGDATRPGWPVVYMNRAIARDYGYEPSALLGKGPSAFFPEDLNHVQLEGITQALSAGREVRTEMRGRRKDGSMFWVGFFKRLRSHTARFGATLTEQFVEYLGPQEEPQGGKARKIPLRAVQPGMIIAQDVRTEMGTLLVPSGFEVTAVFLERLRHFGAGILGEAVAVEDAAPAGAASSEPALAGT